MKHLISWVIRKIPRKYLQLFSHWVLKILVIFYRGNKVECVVCQRNFRKFLPYGRVPRENALCPNCLSLERHRLMWLYLKEKTNFFDDDLKVLHIAPEICFIDRFEQLQNIEYITADLESPLAKVKMDIHEMPFEDDSFDIVFCNHVMEHVDDDIKAMQEIKRVLNKDGWAIIQSPIDPTLSITYEDKSLKTWDEREKAHGQGDHLRTYGQDYGKRLASAGFQVKEDQYVQSLSIETIQKYALPREEIIFKCKKPLPH